MDLRKFPMDTQHCPLTIESCKSCCLNPNLDRNNSNSPGNSSMGTGRCVEKERDRITMFMGLSSCKFLVRVRKGGE